MSARKAASPLSGDTSAFLSEMSLQVPEYVEDSAWFEHGAFAAWVIEATQPRVLAELGTHGGFSYFAFCQAVATLGTDTTCYAVDHWQGDEHAGFYDDSIYQRVKGWNESHFADFSTLLRYTFDDAREYVEDGSVDLLHIDGRHFYDDAKHDFETWIPKLSERAIVLFHDTNVFKRDFGVHQLWAEIKDQHPSFEFLHGYGLGVLAVGPDVPEPMQQFFAATSNDEGANAVRALYSRLGRAISGQFQARSVEELKAGLLGASGAVAERDKALNALETSRWWKIGAPLRRLNLELAIVVWKLTGRGDRASRARASYRKRKDGIRAGS